MSPFARSLARSGRDVVRRAQRRAATAAAVIRAPLSSADLAVFHEFEPPPSGGGHQFLRALLGELRRQGWTIESNRLGRDTPACLVNSFNFDFERLARLAGADHRVVHRVDGPVGIYRGTDDGTDRRIQALNGRLASATVFQSRYSLERHLSLGLEFRAPVVIHNAPDPRIFHPRGRDDTGRRKLRLISAGWSDNPNKGAADYRWLEGRMDWSAVEYTFVGRSATSFERIASRPPVGSVALAEILRAHDVLVFASRHEACSNLVLEALACGLPVIYADSGSTGELVGEAGLGYAHREQLPELVELMRAELAERRSAIRVPALIDVARGYAEVLRGDLA
jgi:glycosyltransferase involved in cell wall biosynthesis